MNRKGQEGNKNHMWRELDTELIRIYYVDEGLSETEIAKRMKCSRNAVSRRIGIMNLQKRDMNILVKEGIHRNIHKFQEASRGENNPAYIHGKQVGQKKNRHEYLQVAKTHFQWKCHYCGQNETHEDLCVHHLDGNNRHNDVLNLVVLCKKCHSGMHTYEAERIKRLNADKQNMTKNILLK